MLVLAKHLYEGGEVSARWIQAQCQVSRATSTRYMLRIECALPVIAESRPTGGGWPRRVLRLMPAARRPL